MVETLHFRNENKCRLDELLRNQLPKASNSKVRRLIIAGAVSVNGRVITRPAFELVRGSAVNVQFDSEKFFYEKQPDDVEFEVTDQTVLYEDENYIFIDKPAFFPVEQTITGNRDNLHDAVVDYLWKRNPTLRNPPYVGIMHRLDRTTSGVIVFTKNRAVNKTVSELFQSHTLTKKYLAVCPADAPNRHAELVSASASTFPTTFTVELFMSRISPKSQTAKWGQVPESKGGQYSKTEFRVLKQIIIEDKPCLLVECTLFTGRTHQIRVHLASRGLPVLGDTLYGGQPAERIYLHSCELTCELFSVKSPWNLAPGT